MGFRLPGKYSCLRHLWPLQTSWTNSQSGNHARERLIQASMRMADHRILELDGLQVGVFQFAEHEHGPSHHRGILRLFRRVVRPNVQAVWQLAFFQRSPVKLSGEHGRLRVGAAGRVFQGRGQAKLVLASLTGHRKSSAQVSIYIRTASS